jgi:hypothetical protein
MLPRTLHPRVRLALHHYLRIKGLGPFRVKKPPEVESAHNRRVEALGVRVEQRNDLHRARALGLPVNPALPPPRPFPVPGVRP